MNPVSITRNGRTYDGSFSSSNGIVAVTYAGHTKRTQIGDMDVLTLAEMILGEMIRS